MPDLKISLITVAYNAESTIERCISSITAQNFSNIQYIIIDGASTDQTLNIIDRYKDKIDILLSEPDKGVYDAMNKGIALATGDIIGTLNADDYFADENILQDVANAFSDEKINIIYGDLDYVDNNGKIIRKWRSGKYRSGQFNWGWMPPHPTFYCRKNLFDKLGFYSLEYGTAADYELMLRFIHITPSNVFYLSRVMVKMIIGGVSNKSIKNRVKAMGYDLKAMRNNGILMPIFTIIFKPVRKILQYF